MKRSKRRAAQWIAGAAVALTSGVAIAVSVVELYNSDLDTYFITTDPNEAAAVDSGAAQHPFMIDKVGEPMRVAAVPWLDIACEGRDRFEPRLVNEGGFACLRTKEAFESAPDIDAPADCWGDVSAATGPLSLALSTIAYWKAYANGPYALLWASSESGGRASALLELQVPARP